MNFKTNFSKTALLANAKIIIQFEDKTVELIPLTVDEYLHDLDCIFVLGLLRVSVEDFNENVKESNFVVNSKIEVLLSILDLKDFKREKILGIIRKIFPTLTFTRTEILCGDSPVSAEEFDELMKMFWISCDEQKFEEVRAKSQEESKVDKKLKEIEEKVKKAKKKRQKGETTENGTGPTIDQIVVALTYEFKSLTPAYIFNMNMFTLMYYYSFLGKVVDNQIGIEAAGNGLSKEYKYFI